LQSAASPPCRNLSSPRRRAGKVYPRFCFQPSSISGPSLVTTTARGVTPLSVITATGMSLGPSPLPCSQSDIRLAAAVTDDAGGLLHHLFTHYHGSYSLWLVRSLLQLSSGPNPAWTHRPVTLPFLRMLSILQDANAKGWESGSSSGENPSDGSLACLSIVKVLEKAFFIILARLFTLVKAQEPQTSQSSKMTESLLYK